MKIPNWDEQALVTSNNGVTKPQASVCFAADGDNTVHETLPLSEYTPEEVENSWWSRSDYNSFKRNSLTTLSFNRSGTLHREDPEHTMRGLESRTRECADSRRIIRLRASAAVFDEQARQFELGIKDPNAISEMYRATSWHAIYSAHTQGMADEQDSQTYFARQKPLSKRKSNVLSKIISIEMVGETELQPHMMECKLQSQSISNNNFNLSSFLNDLSIAT